MITTFYPPYHFGGDGVYVHALSNELARRGHQVEVIHCKDSYRLLAHHEPTQQYDDHPNVTVHGLESALGPLSPLATQQLGAPVLKEKSIRQILEKEFDVIHYHNISLIGGPRILEYGQGIKLYTTHEFWLVCPTHILFRYNREVCTEPHCLTCELSYKRPPQWWRYTRMLPSAARQVDMFLSPSRFGIEQHRARGFNAPMQYLPNFVPDVSRNDTRPDECNSPLPYFLYVGRLEKLKGAHTLIPLFRQYPRARLLIAGTGSYEKHLQEFAASSPNIEFLGRLSAARLQNLYRNAVALIVPSLCYESAPLVILEAFRGKTPVIARRIGGMIEMIEESGGGILYETKCELATALDELLANRARRDELGQRGYATYQCHHTPESHLTRYLELIETTAARKRVAHA
jgi:glycosyltransferase involved in cell wall biosynthesis